MSDEKTREQNYKALMERIEKLSSLKKRIAQLLADEKCTVDDAESVLNGTKQLIREQTIVQGEF